ncbi:MAG: sigma-70 family RNA polymerase sigma factor [Planctomycetota bacterium]
MLRVREGDASAFEELVRLYQPRLVRLMHHLAPHPSLAEDLAQETFLRVYRARESYQPGAKFATWLFTIAGNVARNSRRGASRRKETSEVDAPSSGDDSNAAIMTTMALDASGLMPTRQAESDERAKIVRLAVNSLHPRQRMALVLSRFENMSYAEIADTMGLTTKAVKSLLSRARVSLRDRLESYVETGEPGDDLATGAELPTMSRMMRAVSGDVSAETQPHLDRSGESDT